MLVVNHRSAAPAARVLSHVSRSGVVKREDIVEATGLSQATVSRAVGALMDVGLLRARPDVVRPGAIGRPSVPVQVDTRRHVVVGVHIGRRTTTVALADVRGRVLVSRRTQTSNDVDSIVAQVASTATELLVARPALRAASAGVVGPWIELGLDQHRVGALLGEALGLATQTADHAAAVAAAEYAVDSRDEAGLTVYVYARDTIGFVTVSEIPGATVISPVSSLAHLPTGVPFTCRCRRVGCLEAVASDDAVARRARASGLIADADIEQLYAAAARGSRPAMAIVRERAAALGRAAAFVRDMTRPTRMVLSGQAFTTFAPTVAMVRSAFENATTLPPAILDVGRFGDDLQAVAASRIALRPLLEDPLVRVSTLVSDRAE